MTKKIFGLVLMAMSTQAFAEDPHYDGSDPLLCTVLTTDQCDIDGCEEIEIEDLGMPRHFHVDFKKKRLSSTQYNQETSETVIDHVEQIDNRLILQGVDETTPEAEDAQAWAIVVADPTGMMTFTLTSEELAIVGFGACAPVE